MPHGELGTLPKEAFKPSVKGLPQELKDVVGTVASPSWYTSNPAGSNLVYANVKLMMHAHAHDNWEQISKSCFFAQLLRPLNQHLCEIPWRWHLVFQLGRCRRCRWTWLACPGNLQW